MVQSEAEDEPKRKFFVSQLTPDAAPAPAPASSIFPPFNLAGLANLPALPGLPGLGSPASGFAGLPNLSGAVPFFGGGSSDAGKEPDTPAVSALTSESSSSSSKKPDAGKIKDKLPDKDKKGEKKPTDKKKEKNPFKKLLNKLKP